MKVAKRVDHKKVKFYNYGNECFIMMIICDIYKHQIMLYLKKKIQCYMSVVHKKKVIKSNLHPKEEYKITCECLS